MLEDFFFTLASYIFFSDKSWTSEKITVPDGVTFLGAVVLVMSENLGLGFTPVPQKVRILLL